MSRARLRILRVVIGLNQGGVQQAVSNLFHGLDPARFEPMACTIEVQGRVGGELADAGFPVINLGRVRQPLPTVRELAAILRERRIDIVHASSYHPSLYARLAAALAGTPVRISHEHTVLDRKRPQRVFLNRLLQPATDGYIAVGRMVAQQVRDWYGYPPHKVRVIHNGVDTARFRPAPERRAAKAALGLNPELPVVGIVSRLDPLKGHRFLFQAAARLRHSHPAQWLVVGQGRNPEEEGIVRRQAEQHGVTDLVQFLGMRRDVPQLLAAMDIYCLPTLKEGFSNAVIEAMAAGCALVVSDWPGNLEAVTPGVDGLVTPMGESEQLTAALAGLLADPGRRAALGAAARGVVVERFSVAAHVAGVAAFYEELWHNRRRGR